MKPLKKSEKYTLKDGYLFEVVRKYNEISNNLKDKISSKKSFNTIIDSTMSTILNKLNEPPESEQEYTIIDEFLKKIGIGLSDKEDTLRKSNILSSIKNLWYSGDYNESNKGKIDYFDTKLSKYTNPNSNSNSNPIIDKVKKFKIIGKLKDCRIPYSEHDNTKLKYNDLDTSRTINDEFLLNLEEKCKKIEELQAQQKQTKTPPANPTQIQKSNAAAQKQAQVKEKQEEKELESESKMILDPIGKVVKSEKRNEFLDNLDLLIFRSYKLDTSNSTDIQSQDDFDKDRLQKYLTFVTKEFDNDEADAEKTREVKLSGKKDKVDTKPQTKLNPSEYGHIDAAG